MATNKDKEQMLPKVGNQFEIDGLQFTVVFVNPGKLRVTIELSGVTETFFEAMPTPIKKLVTDVLYGGKRKVSENVTLDVHSGTLESKAKF